MNQEKELFQKKYYFFEINMHSHVRIGIIYGEFDHISNRLSGQIILNNHGLCVYLSKTSLIPTSFSEIEETNHEIFKNFIIANKIISSEKDALDATSLIFEKIKKNEPPPLLKQSL